MILIKDRHLGEFHKLCPFSSKGTMILIKDRHISPNVPATNAITTGNYDTYKGSTLIFTRPKRSLQYQGTMILIKDYVFGVICFCFELLLFDWLKRTSEDVLFNLFSFRLINLNCLTYKQ